jgi:hypothetical protein
MMGSTTAAWQGPTLVGLVQLLTACSQRISVLYSCIRTAFRGSSLGTQLNLHQLERLPGAKSRVTTSEREWFLGTKQSCRCRVVAPGWRFRDKPQVYQV